MTGVHLAQLARIVRVQEDGSASAELVRVIDQIARAADVRAAQGIRVVRVRRQCASLEHIVIHTGRVLAPLGFLVIRADQPLGEEDRKEACHRHVVLVAPENSVEGARWIRDLSRVSTRSHLLVLVEDLGQEGERVRGREGENVERDTSVFSHPLTLSLSHPLQLAARLIACGELRRAEALLQSAVALAASQRQPVDPAITLCRAQLYFWQGRFEAAQSVLASAKAPMGAAVTAPVGWSLWTAMIDWAITGDLRVLASVIARLRPRSVLGRTVRAEWWLSHDRAGRARQMLLRPTRVATGDARLYFVLWQWLMSRCVRSREPTDDVMAFVRTTGARGIFRWGIGRQAMNLLHGVTTLLQVVHDADDEFLALRQGCAWIRREAGAEAAGVAAADGTVIVADGFAKTDWEHADVRESIRAGRGRTIVEGPSAMVTAPMRYGGTTIGSVVIRGAHSEARTFGEAAAALACACAPALRARLDALACAGAGESLATDIIGRSPPITALRDAIARAAATQFPVLIEGESGTGKELVARALHRLSPRRDRRWSPLNCAALSDELAEAELFGHTRGAFTGAVNARAGLFEETHTGTLFLDEISELSPRAQAKLLRVLQEREIRRVGEHAARPVDVRVIAATNVSLDEAVARGGFRRDLLYRLAVVRITVAPLRDRVEDVPLLAMAFWRALVPQTNKRALLGPDAVAALCRYAWPGNVRELQNAIAALIVAAPSRGRVTSRHVEQILSTHGGQPDVAAPLEAARRAFERRMIAAALARHGGRQTSAAVDLGLSRQGLAKAIKRLGLGYHRPGAEVRHPTHRHDAAGALGRRHARVLADSSRAG